VKPDKEIPIDWTAKFRAKHARALTQPPPPPHGLRLIEEHRQAIRDCDHEGASKRNDRGEAWCARCGARLG